ncbi:metal-dependent hydrolase [Fischerella major]|nr:metal-dependent hydrolase [Fischerella major]
MFLGFMAVTHAVIAAAGTSLILGTADPYKLGLAVLGSQLPDLDTTKSTIGAMFFPVSGWIEKRFPHRSITHSLLATAAIAAVSLLIGHLLGDIWTAIALPLGHLLACFSDTFTRQGVQLFFPNPVWAISVSNPNRRIITGSPSEYWVLVSATAALVLGIWLATSGGTFSKVGQGLGLRSSALDVYNASSPTHHVYADVRGVLAIDSTSANGKYFIVAVDGSEFIIQNTKGIYKTGEQLITDRLTASVGEEAKTIIQTLTFDDTEAIASLTQLIANNPNAAIFLDGTLAVDFPEEIKVQADPATYPVIEVMGSNVKLSWCPIDKALLALRDQYAVGTLTVKVVSPKPET